VLTDEADGLHVKKATRRMGCGLHAIRRDSAGGSGSNSDVPDDDEHDSTMLCF
jgi:hypothetical protein